MSPHWTAFAIDVECGSAAGPHVIPAGDPVHVVTRAVRRCEAHSSVPVDWAAVDAAWLRLEQQRRAPVERPPSPVVRVTVPRRLVPLSEIADSLPFDPRAAAAGDRHD